MLTLAQVALDFYVQLCGVTRRSCGLGVGLSHP